jgi:hypothetical protein
MKAICGGPRDFTREDGRIKAKVLTATFFAQVPPTIFVKRSISFRVVAKEVTSRTSLYPDGIEVPFGRNSLCHGA